MTAATTETIVQWYKSAAVGAVAEALDAGPGAGPEEHVCNLSAGARCLSPLRLLWWLCPEFEQVTATLRKYPTRARAKSIQTIPKDEDSSKAN